MNINSSTYEVQHKHSKRILTTPEVLFGTYVKPQATIAYKSTIYKNITIKLRKLFKTKSDMLYNISVKHYKWIKGEY